MTLFLLFLWERGNKLLGEYIALLEERIFFCHLTLDLLRHALAVGGRYAVIDQDRTAREDFPVLLEDIGRVEGLDADLIRVQDERAVRPEGLPRRRGARHETIVLDESDVRETVHVEVTAVDAGERVILQAQGAGAVGLLPLGGDDRGLERGRIVAHEGDELAVRVDCPVEPVGLRGLLDAEFVPAAEVEHLLRPFRDMIDRPAASGENRKREGAA